MNHRFFEERLFADGPLADEEQNILENHLQTCERCRALRAAWQETQIELQLAQWVAPRQGFSQRWRERYQREINLAQQRRAFVVFLGTSAAAAFFALPFIALLTSPAQPVWLKVVVALYNLSALLPIMEGILTFLLTVFRGISEVLTPSMEVAIGFAFMGLTIIWFAMLRKFSYGRLRT